eukprot:scaffold153220_cov68-Attheya_sp.AAC.2
MPRTQNSLYVTSRLDTPYAPSLFFQLAIEPATAADKEHSNDRCQQRFPKAILIGLSVLRSLLS